MIKLTDNIKRMLNALAFADAGENLTLRQKSSILSRGEGIEVAAAAAAPTKAPPTGTRQQVALYMGSELPADMAHYVAQTCTRLKHGLTVLTFQPESTARALLEPYADMLAAAGVTLQIEMLSGEPLSGLARYLRRHPEVAFLACNETGYLGRSFLNGSQRQDALPVPVVLVTSQEDSTHNVSTPMPGVRAA